MSELRKDHGDLASRLGRAGEGHDTTIEGKCQGREVDFFALVASLSIFLLSSTAGAAVLNIN
jgi:hypothetical protein